MTMTPDPDLELLFCRYSLTVMRWVSVESRALKIERELATTKRLALRWGDDLSFAKHMARRARERVIAMTVELDHVRRESRRLMSCVEMVDRHIALKLEAR